MPQGGLCDRYICSIIEFLLRMEKVDRLLLCDFTHLTKIFMSLSMRVCVCWSAQAALRKDHRLDVLNRYSFLMVLKTGSP